MMNTRGYARELSDPFDGEIITNEYGTYYEVRNVTGNLQFSMPRTKYSDH